MAAGVDDDTGLRPCKIQVWHTYQSCIGKFPFSGNTVESMVLNVSKSRSLKSMHRLR